MNRADPPADGELSFMGHLVELRARLLRAVAAVLLILVALVPFANRLYGWLAKPLLEHLPAGGAMIATDVASPFFAPLKLAFFAAVFVAMPFILYQAWAFVSPGLYKHERRLALPLLVSAVTLFYVGCAFAYYLVLPAVFTFMTSVAPAGVAVMPDISRFLDFALILFLAFGFCFEVPVALVILVAIGAVTPEQLVRSRPYTIVGAFVIAAILTPPDVISQLLLAVPMCLLYEVGIIAARLVAQRTATDEADPAREN
ncbi:MAG TPA: twin-arginine translocase subunit TatC [Dokdonella sp.]|uniref:twin-arginine translocase subunit TatC n=1 Tax=Dokdonella sp. TaxID=2291710 RepID=UPI0025C1CEBE|nr:twin-arginine translocase subunit TatC [Dokdonella sp.]MBX3691132.1 twin-arginine translocase subunit TatC [Dokdonella sp.]MCW5566887.1 twin-arginine translocase subunit TatC [Dokdonella sp.]HNR91948.1 twin-arginine translocase subunit TatC [Dokdonella sp.]